MPYRILSFYKGMGPVMERATDALAILAVLSGINPGILQWIGSISTVAALFMPILGCIWLAVQIWSRVARGK